jgi:hypothetical protein
MNNWEMRAMSARNASAPGAAMSGKEWLEWPAAMKRSYVWGVIDTLSNAPAVSRPVNERRRNEIRYVRLASCLGKGITYDQVYAMVEKFLADNSGQLHADMASIICAAVDNACSGQRPNTQLSPPLRPTT